MSTAEVAQTARESWASAKARMASILDRIAALFQCIFLQWKVILLNLIVLPPLGIVYWTIIAAGGRMLAPILATKLYKVPVPGVFAWMRHYVTWRDIDIANVLALIVLGIVWLAAGLMMHILVYGGFRKRGAKESFLRGFVLTAAPVLILANAALFYASLGETGGIFGNQRFSVSQLIMTILYTTVLVFFAFLEVLCENRREEGVEPMKGVSTVLLSLAITLSGCGGCLERTIGIRRHRASVPIAQERLHPRHRSRHVGQLRGRNVRKGRSRVHFRPEGGRSSLPRPNESGRSCSTRPTLRGPQLAPLGRDPSPPFPALRQQRRPQGIRPATFQQRRVESVCRHRANHDVPPQFAGGEGGRNADLRLSAQRHGGQFSDPARGQTSHDPDARNVQKREGGHWVLLRQSHAPGRRPHCLIDAGLDPRFIEARIMEPTHAPQFRRLAMNVFEMIDRDDCVQLACLCAILHWVGSRMASPDAQRWAWRGAGTAYIYFCIHSFYVLKPTGADDLLHIAFRALFAGWLAGGVGLLSISALLFLVRVARDRFPASRPAPIKVEPHIVYIEKPATAPPPPEQPTKEEQHAQIVKEHEENIRLIEGAPIEPEEKESLKIVEKESVLAHIANLIH